MRRVLVLVCATWAGASGLAAAEGSLRFVDDVIVAKSADGPRTALFQVILADAESFPVTVQWATQDVTATSTPAATADYTAARGELTFNDNRILPIQVQINADSTWEGAETFYVNLSSAVGAQLVDNQAHGVITDRGSDRARCDLDGDGRSDVLIRVRLPHERPAQPTIHNNRHDPYTLRGTVLRTAIPAPWEGQAAAQWEATNTSHWEALAANDFDGSGSGCDVLWKWNCTDGAHDYHGRLALTRSSDFDGAVRAPEDPEVLQDVSLPAEWQSMVEWEVVGSGRFDHDAKADVLWWNPGSGKLRVWSSTGQGFATAGNDLTVPSLNSRAIGVLDIDDDGDADILWRNSDTGELFYWQMQGGLHTGGGSLTPGSLVDPCWQLVSTGDFNGDGHDDLHWQNQNSQRSVVWFMNGPVRLGGSFLSPDHVGVANDPTDLKCPATCVRDCSAAPAPWYVEGPR